MVSLVTQFERPVGHLAGGLTSAEASFEVWCSKSATQRGTIVANAAATLDARKSEFALAISLEMHKRISQSTAEVELSVDIIDYYAKCALGLCARDRVAPLLREISDKTHGRRVLVCDRSSPSSYFEIARFVALNLTVGNVVALIHAGECPLWGVAFEHLWLEVGAPLGVFTNVAESNHRVLGSLDEAVKHRSASLGGSSLSTQETVLSSQVDSPPNQYRARRSA